MNEFWTAYLQNMLLVLIGVAAGIPLGKLMGYDEGYGRGFTIGIAIGTLKALKGMYGIEKTEEDGDAE